MTDGGPLDHRVEDMTDEELMAAIQSGLALADTVPPEVVAAAKASFTWRTIDAELAALTFDSSGQSAELAGVRGGEHGPRALTFEYEDVVVEVEVDDAGDGRTVVGQIDPPTVEWIEVHQASASEPLRLEADGRGRFRARGVGAGPFRLLCRFRSGARFPMLLTDWVSI
jgi:hypothetical protein